jgi:hypothetical protein
MGLTIHYTLKAPPDTDAAQARELVRRLRRCAMSFKQRGRVDDLHPQFERLEAEGEARGYASHLRKVLP